jgi:hypothetical protein
MTIPGRFAIADVDRAVGYFGYGLRPALIASSIEPS